MRLFNVRGFVGGERAPELRKNLNKEKFQPFGRMEVF
jgi:hypothetical protein